MQDLTENTIRSTTSTHKEAAPKILMAEDNLVNQKLASLLFKSIQYQVQMVSNGRDAVDAAINGSYDLVFMDIQMPLMDGVEASQKIKEQMGDKAPVIIAITANTMQGDKEKFLEAGMDHYIAKPISKQDLSKYIEMYVTG